MQHYHHYSQFFFLLYYILTTLRFICPIFQVIINNNSNVSNDRTKMTVIIDNDTTLQTAMTTASSPVGRLASP
jgi:hypothetical protein